MKSALPAASDSVITVTPPAQVIVHEPLPAALAPADFSACPQLSPNCSTMHENAQATDTSSPPSSPR